MSIQRFGQLNVRHMQEIIACKYHYRRPLHSINGDLIMQKPDSDRNPPTQLTRRVVLKQIALGTLGVLTIPHFGIGKSLEGQVESQEKVTGLLIRNGLIVNADGRREGDVLIRGDKIVEIGRDLPAPANGRIIDAKGLQVLPGGIDPHVHLSRPWVDDLTSGSMAALAGGITTLGLMSGLSKGETIIDMLDRNTATIREQAITDFMIHSIVWNPTKEIIEHLPLLASAGQPSIKIFMMSEHFDKKTSEFLSILELARGEKILPMIHCEDRAILEAAKNVLLAKGQKSLKYYAASRPTSAEMIATQKAIALCEAIGVPMYFVHLSCESALRACADAQARNLPIYVETRPLYLHMTSERFQNADGPIYVGQPPLRQASDVAALWRGLASGAIHTMGTDHAPWTREQKLDPTLDITKLRPGVNNLQVMLPMLYSEGVLGGRITLERFVTVTSTNAAKLFGMYPRKGKVAVGSDADIALWDPGATRSVRAEDGFSKAGFSIYEGWKVVGWPLVTIRRGEVVYENQQIKGRPGSGQLISRNRWNEFD